MRYMLDTDSCIALIKRRSGSMLRRLTSLQPGETGISAVTLAELHFGVEKSAHREKNRLALTEFLLPLEVADFDEAAAESYGSIRATLEKSGTPIGPLDTQIGAHALSRRAVLVTHNLREFRRIPRLVCEDWLS
ncbi:MAG: type II toxin-antitoxin system VapC family toxin [Candidatus Aminicenantes bacterium]|nr:type II toxin-antitoxin system VapC family toxin [Candidatus Aminicenantes bacterium]